MKKLFNYFGWLLAALLALVVLAIPVLRTAIDGFAAIAPPSPLAMLAALVCVLAAIVLAVGWSRVPRHLSLARMLLQMKAGWLVPLLLLFFTAPPLKAGDFAVQKTFWSASSITNAAGVVTNLAAVVDVTQVADFDLEFTLGFTNASAGTYDVRWTTGNDGSNFATSPAAVGSSGWFSVPLTNGGTVVRWRTNVTVGTAGYWKLDYGTNLAVQHLTSAVVRAYIKPKRTNRDY